MKKRLLIYIAIGIICGCKKTDIPTEPDNTYNPEILTENFTWSSTLTNPYFLMEEGKTYVFEGEVDGGTEHIEVFRRDIFKSIMGIECIVVNDKVTIEGVLVEDTDDWYAQDNTGNVWYMGEYVTDFNPDGSIASHEGSWEYGVDDAFPGYQMLAVNMPGEPYYQEYYPGEAEDMGQVTQIGLTITVPVGTFDNCIEIKETSELIPDFLEYKYYAPGVGLIKAVNAIDGEEVVLIEIIE